MSASPTHLLIAGRRLEVQRLGVGGRPPTLLFLHEGLGCVALWRDFPRRLVSETGCGAVVFSRYGYGRSDPFEEPRTVRYMHDEAAQSLPVFLDQLSIDEPLLVGHSDGASIALLYAAVHPVAGLVLLAPHVFVEEVSIRGIEAARRAYVSGDLRPRLARYHTNPDATFFGWNDVWLSPEFSSWNIEDVLGRITCPVLVVQGTSDPYGTLAQVRAVAAGVQGDCTEVTIDDCGHSPHLEAPEQAVEAVTRFVAGVVARRDGSSALPGGEGVAR